MKKTEKSLRAEYTKICENLGDVIVVIATYEGLKNNLLIEAGKLQREIKKLKEGGVCPEE